MDVLPPFISYLCWEKTDEKNALRRRRKTLRDMDDWTSDGNELQRSDAAATGNVRRPPTVVSRNGGTSS